MNIEQFDDAELTPEEAVTDANAQPFMPASYAVKVSPVGDVLSGDIKVEFDPKNPLGAAEDYKHINEARQADVGETGQPGFRKPNA